MVYTFFDEKNFSGGIKNKNMSDQEFTEELHKWKVNKKRKVHPSFYRQCLGCWSCRYALYKEI